MQILYCSLQRSAILKTFMCAPPPPPPPPICNCFLRACAKPYISQAPYIKFAEDTIRPYDRRSTLNIKPYFLRNSRNTTILFSAKSVIATLGVNSVKNGICFACSGPQGPFRDLGMYTVSYFLRFRDLGVYIVSVSFLSFRGT